MNEANPFTDFCAAVRDQIRFWPDQADILAELWDHLEDHADALKEQGMPILDAREAAVAAMGDPVELGRALDQLHGPVAGWLLVALKWASRLAAAGVVLLLALHLWGLPDLLGSTPSLSAQEEAEYQLSLEHAEEVLLLHPTAAAHTEDYALSIPYALRNTWEDGSVSLSYELKVTHWDPWYRAPDLDTWIAAEDDLGNVYPDQGTYWLEELPAGTPRSWGGGSALLDTPFTSYYGMTITGLDPGATQLTLILQPFGARECALTFSLEGGGPS